MPNSKHLKDRHLLECRLRQILRDAAPLTPALRRAALRDTIAAAGIAALARYYFRHSFGTDDIDRMSEAELNAAISYCSTVITMISEQADANAVPAAIPRQN